MPFEPVRTIAALEEPGIVPEQVAVVSGTSCLWSDVGAIQRDFPAIAGGASACEQFVECNASILAANQIVGSDVNEAVNVSGVERTAYRPPQYGRALIIEARELTDGDVNDSAAVVGLLDVKGVGVGPDVRPCLAEHSNGLLLLNQAIEELLYQKIVEEIFRRENLDVAGLPVYALVDLGFRGRTPQSSMLSCAALVRRAHRRRPGGTELPATGSAQQRIQLLVELVLRRYGLTTANTATRLVVWRNGDGDLHHVYGDHPAPGVDVSHVAALLDELDIELQPGQSVVFEGVNVQTTRELSLDPVAAQLVDFGHYNVAERFDNPLFSPVEDRFLNWGGAFWPSDETWVNPDPECRVNSFMVRRRPLSPDLADWCGAAPGTWTTGLTELGLELARKIDAGAEAHSLIETTINEFVERLFARP